MNFRVFTLAAGLLLLAYAGCGNVGAISPNDQPPNGTIVADGSFTGSNVSGTATIYQLALGSYVVRLAQFSAPQETGLQVAATVDGKVATRVTLRATSGNQNYPFTYPVGSLVPQFDQVAIHSVQTNQDYGLAPLIQKSTSAFNVFCNIR